MDSNFLITTLIGFGGTVIGWLVNDNRGLRSATKSIRALALGLIIEILKEDQVPNGLHKYAEQSAEELKKTY
ncbi:MAG: hypothetical protein OHK0017_07870 [Patescibacteria group bacterium]